MIYVYVTIAGLLLFTAYALMKMAGDTDKHYGLK